MFSDLFAPGDLKSPASRKLSIPSIALKLSSYPLEIKLDLCDHSDLEGADRI